jgi:hypothetical protein
MGVYWNGFLRQDMMMETEAGCRMAYYTILYDNYSYETFSRIFSFLFCFLPQSGFDVDGVF